MDNRINDKDLEFVNGGVNNSEEAISGAIGLLQRAVERCAQSQRLSIFFEPIISDSLQRLQSCNGDFEVIIDVVNDLSHISDEIIFQRDGLPDGVEQRIYGNVHSYLLDAIDLLS